MHDSQIEEQLRGVLRAEGDGIPLTITAAELERRLAARRSATAGGGSAGRRGGGRRRGRLDGGRRERLAQAAGDRDRAKPQRLGRGYAPSDASRPSSRCLGSHGSSRRRAAPS